MPELEPPDPHGADAPLRDVRVLEIEGALCAYAGRLLASLGADVVRVTFGARSADPYLDEGKSTVELETTPQGRKHLLALAVASDIVLREAGSLETSPRDRAPRLIDVVLSPFGATGPAMDSAGTDLVRLAASGLLWLGGYPDAEPMAPYGDQSALATGLFAAVAALLALVDRDATGDGCTIDVSSQEVLAQALETALPEYELTGRVRRRLGDTPREAGTGLYTCADGFVSMVAGRLGTAAAWRRLREWLDESGTPGADELWSPEWETLSFRQRPASIARFTEIFGAFASSRTKAELYCDAQARGIALAPVNSPKDVLADPQLVDRRFFRPANGGPPTLAPPFRFSPLRIPAPDVPAPVTTA